MKKIKTDDADRGLLLQFWPNQSRFPLIFKMQTDAPVLLTSRKNLLYLLQLSQSVHLIWRNIYLLLRHVVGFSQKTVGYLKKLQISLNYLGDPQHIRDICTNSHSTAYKVILISLKQISKELQNA